MCLSSSLEYVYTITVFGAWAIEKHLAAAVVPSRFDTQTAAIYQVLSSQAYAKRNEPTILGQRLIVTRCCHWARARRGPNAAVFTYELGASQWECVTPHRDARRRIGVRHARQCLGPKLRIPDSSRQYFCDLT